MKDAAEGGGGGGGWLGYSLQWPIRGGSTRKGYPLRLQVYEREGISLAEVYERVGKSAILASKKASKGLTYAFCLIWL